MQGKRLNSEGVYEEKMVPEAGLELPLLIKKTNINQCYKISVSVSLLESNKKSNRKCPNSWDFYEILLRCVA